MISILEGNALDRLRELPDGVAAAVAALRAA